MATSSMSLFLPIETQNDIVLYERVLFGIATTLNIVSFVCLINRTPPNQATFRKYLILIQILLLTTDTFVEALTIPICLFPVIGGYCLGPLCQAGLQPRTVFGLIILLNANVGFSILMCVIYRHQSLLTPGSRLKMSENLLLILRVLSYSVLSVIPSLYILVPTDYGKVESEIDMFAYNVTWIRTRGVPYYFQNTTSTAILLVCALLVVLISVVLFLTCSFLHMFYIVKKNTIARSTQNSKKLHRSLQILFVQLAIPLLVVVFPGFVVFLGIATETLISFEVSLTMFFVSRLHSVVHNVSLLSLTSAYHDFILSVITCHRQKKNTECNRIAPIIESKAGGIKK